MADPNKGARRQRGSLSARSIVEAAVAIVEKRGLSELTMTTVARAISVPVTSVHWHFRTRDDLLDAIAALMANRYYDALPPVDGDGRWDDALAQSLRAMRQQLLGMGSFLELSFYRVGVLLTDADINQRMMGRMEAEISLLVDTGLPAHQAFQLHNACNEYVRGFVLVELAHARAQRPIVIEDHRILDPSTYPVLSQLATIATFDGASNDQQFDLGIAMMLDAIRLRIEQR